VREELAEWQGEGGSSQTSSCLLSPVRGSAAQPITASNLEISSIPIPAGRLRNTRATLTTL
jgi:hypothetical protein